MLLPAGISGESPDFTIDNSLRFRSSASAYLTRTPSSTGDRTEWTWSAWVKHSALGTNFGLFSVDSSAATNQYLSMLINSSDEFQIFEYTGAAYTLRLATNAVFRDPSAWYHLVCAVDTDQATSSDRVKLYVNGVQQTSLRLSDYPSSGLATYANVSGNLHAIGATVGATTTPDRYMDGYMTEINFIDGQQLAPIDFGETDEDTGVWKPKAYSGTYGTNGFYLDGSGVTDSSGNGNNWTNNNLNLTTSSATTYDLMTDVPTLTDENTANYCTWNPLDSKGSITPVDGNLKATIDHTEDLGGTFSVAAGKYYWEVELDSFSSVNAAAFGIMDTTHPNPLNTSAAWRYYRYDGTYWNGSSNSTSGLATYTTGDIVGIALDLDSATQTVAFYKNGTLQTTENLTADLKWTPFARQSTGTTSNIVAILNAGQRPFAYTPPTGFKALNTYNVPDATIEDGLEHFEATTYSGTSARRDVSLQKFNPSFIWTKARNTTYNHFLYNEVVGTSTHLSSNLTSGDQGNNGLVAFSPQTADFGYDLTSGQINETGKTYVSWNWKANGSGVSNTVGSIPSTVSANTTSGFSILTYTGNATSGATVGHGLGIAPKFLFTKSRTTGTYDWVCQHTSLGGTKRIWLNLTSAENTSSGPWNNTDASASVVTLGNFAETNANGDNFVMYCFADVEGFSAFGSYTGNGSADGPFVYTGFSPSWLLIKRSDAAANWLLYDNKRLGYNTNGYYLLPDGTWVEGTGADNRFDLISNGFKVRDSNQSLNVSGGTYIYAAFAENPFKNALAR